MKCPTCGQHRASKGKGEEAPEGLAIIIGEEDDGDDPLAAADDEGDEDEELKAKDDVLAELEGMVADGMGKRLEKRKPKKKEDEDEDV